MHGHLAIFTQLVFDWAWRDPSLHRRGMACCCSMVEARSTLTGAEPAKCTMSDAAKASTGDLSGIPVACRGCLTQCATKSGAEQQACVAACTRKGSRACPNICGTRPLQLNAGYASMLPEMCVHLPSLLSGSRHVYSCASECMFSGPTLQIR